MSVHFDAIADEYHQKAAGTQQAVYDQISQWIDPLVSGKVVLDVGNGGKFAYDVALPSAVTALDLSEKMLAKISNPRVIRLIGNALNMNGVADSSVDFVILGLVLHHIAGSTRRETLSMLRQVLTSARRVLRPGGAILVTETVASPILSGLQRLAYPVSHAFLAPRVGMLYFFSQAELKDAIADVFGRVELHQRTHRIAGWLDPFPGTFPGVLKVPAWTFPMQFRSYLAHV